MKKRQGTSKAFTVAFLIIAASALVPVASAEEESDWPQPVEDNQVFSFLLIEQLEFRNVTGMNMMRLDVQGAETVRKLAPEALLIFMTTDSEEELVTRLKARNSETKDELALRIATARKELKRVEAFDYVIINHHGKVDDTVENVRAIIDAEHHRVNHREVNL